MVQRGKIGIVIPNSEELEEVPFEFSDEEWNVLSRYTEYTEAILATRLFKDRVHVSLNINYKQGQKLEFTSNVPSEEILSSFLHRFRRIGLQGEYANFYKVTKIISKCVKNDKIRQLVKHEIQTWNGTSYQNMVQLRLNGRLINSEEILLLWLNAYEYHADEDKRREFDAMTNMIPFESLKGILLLLLLGKSKAAWNIVLIIQLLKGKIIKLEIE